MLSRCRGWIALFTVSASLLGFSQSNDAARLKGSYRFERAHWIYVHLEGSPSRVGYQHGSLLSKEIEDALATVKYKDTYRTKRDWNFFRDTAKNVLWPHIEDEYRQELQGIAAGLNSKGVKADVWDVVALNAMEEVPDYYLPTLENSGKQSRLPGEDKLTSPGNCSAFVATGSYTKDGHPVIAHSNWTSIANGSRWRIMYDIKPAKGHHMLMDGFPGIIVSDDDFGINDAGIMVTETTITGFDKFDANGKPEFVRARKAFQYASSIDEYAAIMLDGNNGGYANDWLLADNNTGEVGRFELGLKFHKLEKSKDGYFVGSNFPSDPEIIKSETNFDSNDAKSSPNARHIRWEQLMKENKGKIDIEMAKKFLADHVDSSTGQEARNERALCGHVDQSEHGVPEWSWGPYYPGGTVNSNAADYTMAKSMTVWGRTGRSCGEDFVAADFFKKHPEWEWMRKITPDMKGQPWATFKAGEKK
jgi:hypothetical protein